MSPAQRLNCEAAGAWWKQRRTRASRRPRSGGMSRTGTALPDFVPVTEAAGFFATDVQTPASTAGGLAEHTGPVPRERRSVVSSYDPVRRARARGLKASKMITKFVSRTCRVPAHHRARFGVDAAARTSLPLHHARCSDGIVSQMTELRQAADGHRPARSSSSSSRRCAMRTGTSEILTAEY